MLSKLLISLLWVITILTISVAKPQYTHNLSYKQKEYRLRLQPELDVVDISKYIFNPRLLNLQIKCLLFDGPCDIVGRWMKRKKHSYFKCSYKLTNSQKHRCLPKCLL